MKSIFHELLRGSAREKLSVISDLLSITGISLGVAIAPLFAIKSSTQLRWFSVVGIFFYSLLSFAGLAMLLVLLLFINSRLIDSLDKSFSSNLIRASAWSVSAAIYLIAIATVISFLFTVSW
jgi:hypothetical protein